MNFVFKINLRKEIPPLIPPATGEKNDVVSNHSFVGIIYNANRYQGEKMRQRIIDSNKIAKYLNENGIPARTSIENKDGEDLSIFEINGKKRFFGLYNFLHGETLPWEAYTRRHLRSLGVTMRKMHDLLNNHNFGNLHIPKWKEYLENDFSNFMKYFSKNARTICKKLGIEINKDVVSNIYCELLDMKEENQIIHNDFVRGNILFSNQKQTAVYPITGILDFEKVMYAPRSADIARTLAFLLVDCKYKNAEQIHEYFLTQGYGKIKLEEFDSLLLYYWLRDLWKFLSCNPYEDLKLNFHYNETVKRLLERSVIRLRVAGSKVECNK